MEYYGGNFYPAREELSPMIAPVETRLDQLEALAATTLIAIRELADRQEASQKRLDSEHDRFGAFDQRMDRLSVKLEEVGDRLDRVSLQQELNGQQIASNAAGIVELRNLVADLVRGQG